MTRGTNSGGELARWHGGVNLGGKSTVWGNFLTKSIRIGLINYGFI